MDCIHDVARADEEVLVVLCGRRNPVLAAQNKRSCIQIVEAELGEIARDIVHDAASLASLADQNHAARLLDGFCDHLIVEGNDASHIDDFCGNAIAFQRLSGIQRAVERRPKGQDRNIVACSSDNRLTEGNFVVAFRNALFDELLGHIVDLLALEEDTGSVPARAVFIMPFAS